jgi:hypothetical protein
LMRAHWVAVPEAWRARRVNRRPTYSAFWGCSSPRPTTARCAGRFHRRCGAILTEIYVGHACSCRHILRTEPAAQALVIPAELASSSSSSSSSDTDAEEAANDLAAVRCSSRHMRLDVWFAHMRDGRNQRLASRRYIEASCADTHGGLIQTVGGRRWRTWCRL